jgi:post-segregation antitoxin (ccd killing protein)
MGKRSTTLYVDSDVIEKLRLAHVNISKSFELWLREQHPEILAKLTQDIDGRRKAVVKQSRTRVKVL